MKTGLNDLAALADDGLDNLLKCIFNDMTIGENQKLNLVINEAAEIYETGNGILTEISNKIAADFPGIK
jgi:acyl CoA:acetate/3-ketoacid CoA transferase